MTNNTSAKNLADNAASRRRKHGEWVLTLYEPYHLPAEPPYHVPPEPKEDGAADEGWVLTVYESVLSCLSNLLSEDSS